MTSTHNILVCTEDSVLAKKVRILLARDECEVEILSNPHRLDRRLTADPISLLVLSNRLADEDTAEILSRLAESIVLPPTIVLGDTAQEPPDFVQIVSDPADTQAIYRLASEALATNGRADGEPALPPIDRLGLESSRGKTQRMKPTRGPREPTAKSNEPPPLDLEGMEFPSSAEIEARLSNAGLADDEFEISGEEQSRPTGETNVEDITVFDVASYHAAKSRGGDNLGLAGVLDPVRFAKVLFQCWTMEAQGALVVATTDETITVTFEDGLPVHLESNVHGDHLGKNLVSKGKLTDAQYSDAAKLAIERGLSIGGAIVELGFLNRDSYGRELGDDAHDRIVRRFASRGGAFEFVPNRRAPIADRPYRISVGRILVEGLKRFADDAALTEICGEVEHAYFKVRSTIEELGKRFPLTDKEKLFLSYSGRAYNVADAADASGLDVRAARVLMALLITCDEYEEFTPGVAEFEARLKEERDRLQAELRAARSEIPGPRTSVLPELRGSMPPPIERTSNPADFLSAPGLPPLIKAPPPIPAPGFATTAPMTSSGSGLPAPAPPVPPAPPPPPPADTISQRPAEGGDASAAIPPMPVPGPGQSGRIPRTVVFSPPMPRGPDGQPQETPERTRSRQHFQRGVTLLGQGNFDDAEEAFRDAIALCSEEHVYLIGLARAVYYNPSYTAVGKIPVLRTIVDRAAHLAPEDGRVLTLTEWVRAAEANL